MCVLLYKCKKKVAFVTLSVSYPSPPSVVVSQLPPPRGKSGLTKLLKWPKDVFPAAKSGDPRAHRGKSSALKYHVGSSSNGTYHSYNSYVSHTTI